jgi:hypothetical protein
MKRIFALLLLVPTLMVAAAPLVHAGEGFQIRYGETPEHLAKKWTKWALGSDTKPFFDPTFCGEQVGEVFLLNGAGLPDVEADCTIPHGVPIVASPGGNLVWKPTDGTTNAELLAALDASLLDVCCPVAELDGQTIDLGPASARTGVYNLVVGEDSFIRAVDPTFPEDLTKTRVAAGGWFFKIVGLGVGAHELVVQDEIGGQVFRATFHITIT